MSASNGLQVLLIEDNAANAYLVRYILEHAGFRVVTAANGAEGLTAARELPALILLDIQLPDMDGYAIASCLKADPALRHIPIVALSSFAMAGERQKALAAGCSGYLEKPLQALQLVRQLREFLPSLEAGS